MKDKEKTVRELVDSFNDRNEVHEAYKLKIKMIIAQVLEDLSRDMELVPNLDIKEWIDQFVEFHFRPEK